MKLLVAVSSRYVRGPDGRVYTNTPHRRSFWQRYLDVFDEVVVLARVCRCDRVDPSWAVADGPKASFWDLPDRTGPWQYLAGRRELIAAARRAVAAADAYLLRSGGTLVTELAWREIRRLGRPYALEITSDPWDALSPGAREGLLRPLGRRIYTRNLRRQCRHARALAYVTRHRLQERYPPPPGAFTTYYSSVDMPPEAYVDQPRRFDRRASRVIYVGDMTHLQKGVDLFVKAVGIAARRGPPVQARVLGDGQMRPQVKQLIRSCGAADRIELMGFIVDRSELRRHLDEADLFVLPSRQEGLPRSMIEAMGRALPCIGTAVGGTPELLDPDEVVPPGDTGALADKIIEVLADPERLTRLSARNLKVAAEYRADVLRPRRRDFYRRLRELSER